jgi:SAM-dependent methyltransferase
MTGSNRIKSLVQSGARHFGYELHRIREQSDDVKIHDIKLLGSVHLHDDMYQGNANHYISVGISAINNIETALELAGKKFSDVRYALDFPCGYGRVLRFLRVRIDPKQITACDINEEAVNFCVSEFGVEPIVSHQEFSKIPFTKHYTLIWAGSLVTHLNQNRFTQLMQMFYNILENNGILIFTTHGMYSIERIHTYGVTFPEQSELKRSLNEDGFFFTPYPQSQDYGISLCTEEYVLRLAQQTSGKLHLLTYKYRGWDDHQDVYCFQRS